MSTAQGIIEAVKVRPVTTGKTPFTSVSYKVGADWFSFIKSKDNRDVIDNLIAGDAVEIDYVVNGNFKNGSSIKLIKNVDVPSAVKTASAVGKTENREFRITYAGSRNTAIAFTKLALDAGALSLPKKVSDIEGALHDYVDSLTVEFANKAWNAIPGLPPVEEAKVTKEIDDNYEE
jgi:hypothetical protein